MSTEALAVQLGIPQQRLAPLERYDPKDLDKLNAVIGKAIDDETKAFKAGLEHALRFVPALLRGAAKMLLFPGGRK